MSIHPTAIVEEGAEIGEGAVIGPYCQIGASAKIGRNVVLHQGVIVTGDTTIGAGGVVHAYTVLGGPPQHLKHGGEVTKLFIGDEVTIREYVTMNAGTVAGGGVTRIGDRGFFMTGAHVAHDCHVGKDVIFANNATLGGHVDIGDSAFLGGLCAIHQNCRIGSFAFIGGCAAVAGDVIPFASAFGNHARLGGLNIIGMKRRNMARADIHRLRALYRLLFEGEGSFKDRFEEAQKTHTDFDEAQRILEFIERGSSRSLMTPAR